MLPIPLLVYWLPPIAWVVYLAWLLLKKPSAEEELFGAFDYTIPGLVERAKALEAFNGTDHKRTLKRVRTVTSKIEGSGLKMSTQALHEAIDEAYLELYFGGFQSRFAPWKRMGWPLKTVFWLGIFMGWLYAYAMVFYIRNVGRDFEVMQLLDTFWYSLLSLPLMLMLGFALNGCFYLLVLLLTVAFPNKPSLERASVVLEEVFKTLRTGSRHEKMIEE